MSDRAIAPAVEFDLTPTGLTRAGRARRAAMLGHLLGRMDDVHRARHRRRRVVAGAHLLAIALLAAVLVPTAPAPRTGAVAEALPVMPDAAPPVRLAVVETDPSILRRYRAAPASRATIVDDQALLGALASIDRPTGLVRRGDRIWLTDDVLAPRLP